MNLALGARWLGRIPLQYHVSPTSLQFLAFFFQAYRHGCVATLAANVAKDVRILAQWERRLLSSLVWLIQVSVRSRSKRTFRYHKRS
jgi:hypothetical protein